MHYWLKRTIRLRTDWKATLSCTGSPAKKYLPGVWAELKFGELGSSTTRIRMDEPVSRLPGPCGSPVP